MGTTTGLTKTRKNLARRARLYPDWPQSAISFPADIIGQVPQAVWDNARLMDQLWNELVEVFERASVLDRKDDTGEPLLSKEERQAVWLPFGQRKTHAAPQAPELPPVLRQLLKLTDAQIDTMLASTEDVLLRSLDAATLRARLSQTDKTQRYDLAAQFWGGTVPSLAAVGAKYKGLMPSAYYESVIARFLVTVKRWQAKPGGMNGPPKHHFGLKSINLPVLFNTGTTLAALTSGSKASLRYTEHLKGTGSDEYRNNGHICVGSANVPVPLHVAYCRPPESQSFRANHAHKALPAEHRIKRVSLVGKHKTTLGWQWSYQIQIEHPPNQAPRQMTGRGCGLDVGYRIREDGLRVACLTDTDGRVIEFVLPFCALGRELRRNVEKFGDSYHIHDWRTQSDSHARLARAKDECKAALKAMNRADWPDEAKASFTGYTKMGIRGLRKLLYLLPAGSPAHELLQAWWEKHQIEARRVWGGEDRLNRIWGDARKQFAAWLCREYDVVVHEARLNLKQLAEQWVSAYDGPLDQARKWRQRASLYEFRQWVKLQAIKQKAELRDGGTAYSTQTCRQCGGAIKPGSNLMLVCENGHKEDQDANASGLFCNQIEVPAGTVTKPLQIPTHLQQYVRILVGTP